MKQRIYGVISGPWHSSEVPDWDHEEDGWGLRFNEGWVVVVQMEDERGTIKPEEVVFEDFEEAMELVDWFKGQIAPYEWEDTL